MPVRATLPCVLVASIVFVSFTFSGKESSSAESGQALGRWLQALWISPSVLRIVLLISHCSNALALHSAFFRVFSRLLSLYLQDSWGRGERLPTSLSTSWEPALVLGYFMLTVGFGVEGLFCGPVFQASWETGPERFSNLSKVTRQRNDSPGAWTHVLQSQSMSTHPESQFYRRQICQVTTSLE